ncbi:MAG TPA: 50S ribosomal protein L5 [Patescibacteria group bacterium]|nr:50S ribosomal protein L5 [Patescibacteria group bacterium]
MAQNYFYTDKIRETLGKEMGLTNLCAVPRMVKIVVNVGAGDAVQDKKVIESIKKEIRLITGQNPVVTKARQSIAAFKIRKGLAIGVKVTLRSKRMLFFLEKLLKIVFPRIRDFRGVSEKSLDGKGNLNIGISEQTLFPEIEYDTIDRIRGLEITIVTNAKDDQSAKKLFELLGMPFVK